MSPTTASPQPPKEDIAFWGTDPNILLARDHVFEFFPLETMTFNQKLNAVTRSIIALSVVMFCTYRNGRLLVVCALTLLAIFVIHRMKTRVPDTPEPFDANVPASVDDTVTPSTDLYQLPTQRNPFANVMPADYDDAENKLPAAPSENTMTKSYILGSVLDQTDANNYPGMSSDILFSDYDKLGFEQSMRPFYSAANTTIPNDQGAFADFCYGTMISCRDTAGGLIPCSTTGTDTTSCGDGSNGFACARNAVRYNLY